MNRFIASMLGLMAFVSPLRATADSAWIDQLWMEHLQRRAGQEESANPILAEAFYRDLFRLDPLSRAAVEGLARLYRSGDEPAMLHCALAYSRLLRIADPVAESQDAQATVEPETDLSPHLEQAIEARSNGEYLQSEVLLRQLLMNHPSEPQLYFELGVTYAAAEEWSMFTLLYAGFAERFPNQFEIDNNLCAGLARIGQPNAAVRILERWLEQAPRDPYLLESAALLAAQAGRTNDAARWAATLEDVTKVQP